MLLSGHIVTLDIQNLPNTETPQNTPKIPCHPEKVVKVWNQFGLSTVSSDSIWMPYTVDTG